MSIKPIVKMNEPKKEEESGEKEENKICKANVGVGKLTVHFFEACFEIKPLHENLQNDSLIHFHFLHIKYLKSWIAQIYHKKEIKH